MGYRGDILKKEIVDKAVKYIEDNYYRTDISLGKVSKETSLSYYYLSHIFKIYCETSFIEYLTKIRLCEAVKLLENPRLNIAQIAFAVGYNDRGYFTKVFKKAYKVSPAKFREKLLKRRK